MAETIPIPNSSPLFKRFQWPFKSFLRHIKLIPNGRKLIEVNVTVLLFCFISASFCRKLNVFAKSNHSYISCMLPHILAAISVGGRPAATSVDRQLLIHDRTSKSQRFQCLWRWDSSGGWKWMSRKFSLSLVIKAHRKSRA